MNRGRGSFIFWAGVFFGGALDHAILALKRADRTPYGFRASVAGNWTFAAIDAAIAAALFAAHRRAAHSASRRSG